MDDPTDSQASDISGTPGPSDTPGRDELAGAADSLNEQVDSAAGGVEKLGDSLGQTIEDGVANAEKSLDNFIDGLDNFLSRF